MTLSRNQLAAISDYVSSTYGSIYEPDNWLEYWTDISEKIEEALTAQAASASPSEALTVAEEEREYQRGAEADFQNHVNYLRRAREWE